MKAERDTRVETLRAGDRVLYCGQWLDIAKVQQWQDVRGPMLVFTCETDTGEMQVFYRPGVFVAADCAPRVEVAS